MKFPRVLLVLAALAVVVVVVVAVALRGAPEASDRGAGAESTDRAAAPPGSTRSVPTRISANKNRVADGSPLEEARPVRPVSGEAAADAADVDGARPPALGLPELDTGAPPPADLCEALRADAKTLRLTESFLEKVPQANARSAGAERLRALRDRTERALQRHEAAAKASGTSCAGARE